MNQLTWRKKICTCLGLALVWVASGALAVTPPPDGGYPGNNTAEGTSALFSRTTGIDNTGLGFQALFHTTTGNFNTAQGFRALFFNSTGFQNTANGASALGGNTSGSRNTATGVNALVRSSTGSENTADGVNALFSNTTGSFNTADGYQALFSNTTGEANTANGVFALSSNTTGNSNTANGTSALFNNTTGGRNTANGPFALNHNTTGSVNTAVGNLAGVFLTTGDNNINIGNGVSGMAAESNTIRIGNTDITDTFITGISGKTASGGAAVFVNSTGKLGTLTSSARFKDEIKSMDKASEAILALRPVSFRYKKELDPHGIPQFGLVAEEVEQVNPDLVLRDADGKPYTVRYEQINAMLLNEFLKEHKKLEEQQAVTAQLKKEIAGLTAIVKEQAAQIRKVNARFGASERTMRVASE